MAETRETKIQCTECKAIGWVQNFHDDVSGLSVAMKILGGWQLRRNPIDETLFEAYCPAHKKPDRR